MTATAAPATGAWPARSWLFIPADSGRKLAKARGCGADCVILDLEDSVAESRKAAARDGLKSFLDDWRPGPDAPRLFVRINPAGSPDHAADIAAAAHPAVWGVVLPKAEGGVSIAALDVALRVAEAEAGLADGSLRIMAIATETPLAVLRLDGYAGASGRLAGLAWGAEDLGAALGTGTARLADGTPTPPFAYARIRMLFGAAAAGVPAIDGITADFGDAAALARDCADAVRDGFSGKLAIHPAQVAPINAAFTPDAGTLAAARAVVAAFAAAPEAGTVALEGRMLDRPHLVAARRLLSRAAALGLLPDEPQS